MASRPGGVCRRAACADVVQQNQVPRVCTMGSAIREERITSLDQVDVVEDPVLAGVGTPHDSRDEG